MITPILDGKIAEFILKAMPSVQLIIRQNINSKLKAEGKNIKLREEVVIYLSKPTIADQKRVRVMH